MDERTRVRRVPDRGRYDRATIDAILDDALVAHVGFVVDGQPYVIPMGVARDGDEIYLHGSSASRLMRHLASEADVCVTVTHLDGLVAARSVFDSSMNYRSVVVLGRARLVSDPDEKLAALRTLVEHLIPGRWDEARPPTEKELKATLVAAVPLDEASAKVRSGPPQDDAADLELKVWAGEIPLRTIALEPVPDPLLGDGIPISGAVSAFVRDRTPGPAASGKEEGPV